MRIRLFVVLKTAAVVCVMCVLDCVVWSVSVYSRFVFSFQLCVVTVSKSDFLWVVVVAVSAFHYY